MGISYSSTQGQANLSCPVKMTGGILRDTLVLRMLSDSVLRTDRASASHTLQKIEIEQIKFHDCRIQERQCSILQDIEGNVARFEISM